MWEYFGKFMLLIIKIHPEKRHYSIFKLHLRSNISPKKAWLVPPKFQPCRNRIAVSGKNRFSQVNRHNFPNWQKLSYLFCSASSADLKSKQDYSLCLPFCVSQAILFPLNISSLIPLIWSRHSTFQPTRGKITLCGEQRSKDQSTINIHSCKNE